MYVFIIKQGMQQFGDYVQRDLDMLPADSGDIAAKIFNWNEAAGGLVIGIASMPTATYYAAPIQRGQMKQNESGRINKVTLSLGDQNFQNSKLFLADLSLIKGAKIVIRRTAADLDPASPDSYRTVFRGYVTGISANEGNLSFEIAERYHDWARPLNKREFSKICNYVFKGLRCQYAGPETFCDKTYTACQGYNNTAHFGGFPEIPGLQFGGF